MSFLNAFSAIGRFLLGISLVCIAIGAAVRGGVGFGLGIAALSVAITGISFVFIGSRLGTVASVTKTLRGVGVAGEATVTALRSLGVRVNGAPILEITLDVDVPVHAPYEATIRQRVPLFWGPVDVGTRVGVLVDPADRQHVAIDWDAVVAQQAASEPEPKIPESGSHDLERLLRVGRTAKGTIVSLDEITEMVELGIVEVGPPGPNDRLFLVDVEVQQAGMSPYEVRVAHPVPVSLIGKVGPRTKVRLAVDREDDRVVAIDWGS